VRDPPTGWSRAVRRFQVAPGVVRRGPPRTRPSFDPDLSDARTGARSDASRSAHGERPADPGSDRRRDRPAATERRRGGTPSTKAIRSTPSSAPSSGSHSSARRSHRRPLRRDAAARPADRRVRRTRGPILDEHRDMDAIVARASATDLEPSASTDPHESLSCLAFSGLREMLGHPVEKMSEPRIAPSTRRRRFPPRWVNVISSCRCRGSLKSAVSTSTKPLSGRTIDDRHRHALGSTTSMNFPAKGARSCPARRSSWRSRLARPGVHRHFCRAGSTIVLAEPRREIVRPPSMPEDQLAGASNTRNDQDPLRIAVRGDHAFLRLSHHSCRAPSWICRRCSSSPVEALLPELPGNPPTSG